MDHFQYQDGQLFCEAVPVAAIAASVGTPVYVYSKATLLHHYRELAESFAALKPTICYSIKSLANIQILKLLAAEGSGFDVVSGGEMHRALRAGARPESIVFAGVGKTDAELVDALAHGIGWINVESAQELRFRLDDHLARFEASLAALRLNPGVTRAQMRDVMHECVRRAGRHGSTGGGRPCPHQVAGADEDIVDLVLAGAHDPQSAPGVGHEGLRRCQRDSRAAGTHQ